MTRSGGSAANPAAVIFGCEGTRLTRWEKTFFQDINPLGFILFGRNVEDPVQLSRLTSELREVVGRCDAPVLIDQEGGRVQRLRPPHWLRLPAMSLYGKIARRNPEAARRGAELQARIIADDLSALGINVGCLPCLDLLLPGADQVIGDRSFGPDPHLIATLGRAVCEALEAGGVAPVIKHMPGHGRARQDSHDMLPRVHEELSRLDADFQPFRCLADQGWGMTAHIVFTAVDPDHPATLSSIVIESIIRGSIGFAGLLVSDDINMQALSGPVGERAAASLAAGCDLVLHCSGDADEMTEVAARVSGMTPAAIQRLERAQPGAPEPFDRAVALEELSSIIGATL